MEQAVQTLKDNGILITNDEKTAVILAIFALLLAMDHFLMH